MLCTAGLVLLSFTSVRLVLVFLATSATCSAHVWPQLSLASLWGRFGWGKRECQLCWVAGNTVWSRVAVRQPCKLLYSVNLNLYLTFTFSYFPALFAEGLGLCVGHTGELCRNNWGNPGTILWQTGMGPRKLKLLCEHLLLFVSIPGLLNTCIVWLLADRLGCCFVQKFLSFLLCLQWVDYLSVLSVCF